MSKKEQKWSRGKKLPGYGWQKYNMCIIYVRMYQLIDTHRQIIKIFDLKFALVGRSTTRTIRRCQKDNYYTILYNVLFKYYSNIVCLEINYQRALSPATLSPKDKEAIRRDCHI